MSRALLGSWIWRTTALIMSVAGLITGLALTGALPHTEYQTGPAAAQTYATASSQSVKDSIPLAFPDLPWLNRHEEQAVGQDSPLEISEPSEQGQPQVIVEEVVAAPTPGCIQEVTRALAGLVAGAAAVNNLDLAQALDGQARQIVASATRCAAQAAGGQAVDLANLAVQQATTVAAQMEGLVGQLAAAPQAAVPPDQPAAGGVGSAVGGVLGLTLGVVGGATGAVGES